MKLFRKVLCNLGSHPNVRFLNDTTGYIQCQDCRRIQQFSVAKRYDDKHPWIEEKDWTPDVAISADHRTAAQDRPDRDGRAKHRNAKQNVGDVSG